MRGDVPQDDAQTRASDADLVARVAARDQGALVELYRRYARRLYPMVCRIAGNESLADEIVQDVFMRLWAKASLYRPADGELSTWLTVVARNLSLDALRRNTRWRAQVELDELVFPVAEPQTHRDRDVAILVRDALRTLPADQRRAVELAYFAGMSHAELAEHFDQPLGTIKSRLRLALVKLREAVTGARRAKVSR